MEECVSEWVVDGRLVISNHVCAFFFLLLSRRLLPREARSYDHGANQSCCVLN